MNKFIFITIIILLCVILILLLFFKYVLPGRCFLPTAKVSVQRMINGQFRLLVERKPFLVKGIVYHPIPIGRNHQYDFWAGPQELWLEDGRLMQRMGVNSVRFFTAGKSAGHTRNVIDQLYRLYGIRTIMGHWMDYWSPGNYADEKYQRDLTRRVLDLVNTYKDEEGLLMWILGNENNLSWHSGARIPWSCPEVDGISDPYERQQAKARIYYSLVNQIARRIKEIDPEHPVALGNADIYTLEVAGEVCPDIDLVALTSYRGKTFGNLWREVKRKVGKPVLIMEFGCDSYNADTEEEDQDIQSVFLKSQWADIERNAARRAGVGNSLGGCIFEWHDEWWKHDEHLSSGWDAHDTAGDWSGGGYYFDIAAPNNINMNEEWWGIAALSPELEKGINRRLPRKAYYDLQKIWK